MWLSRKNQDILPPEETPGLTADDRVSYEKSMNDLEKVMATLSQPKLERPSQISELIQRRRSRVLVHFIIQSFAGLHFFVSSSQISLSIILELLCQ